MNAVCERPVCKPTIDACQCMCETVYVHRQASVQLQWNIKFKCIVSHDN